ncbi:DUF4249 domain-containing protein [Mucilaginibacter agri]|uniref:DUF4249 family protein n=1 Tax=Mucilaginibacter agri TaxID=2695265 RepID=A0A966DRJ5_9SPHI|nr:DUF4249 domain-containing protein [Mucilaginibacter agri]NCD69158.1 DUF4249 family protein [Mucilaginibacter agri]
MKNTRQLFTGIMLLLLIYSCKRPFAPDVVASDVNYLVVEGNINTGADTTIIKLSRTTQLSDSTKRKNETGAKVYVEDDKNIQYALPELASGMYKAALNLKNVQKCRLHIVTKDQKEYVSDYVDALTTPPIDSISYTVTGTGIQLYTYAHDPTNQIKYYRWDFDETWEYVSYYQTLYKYDAVNNKVVPRVGEDIFHCWIDGHSNQILLGSSAGLSQSVINNQPIAYVDQSSGKLAQGYSMLLKQYALTKEAYEYWQKIKKNTEQLGSIFDAQPSALTGNLHNLNDANEPVLGYIGASSVTSKRFLIGHNSLPISSAVYYPPPDSSDCKQKAIQFSPDDTYGVRLNNTFARGDSLITSDYGLPGRILGYLYTGAECVDCRVKMKGGRNVKPPYWPDVL